MATNAEIRPSLGRHLASCPSQTAATCNQNFPAIDLIPNSLYGDRIQQVDLRSRGTSRWGPGGCRGISTSTTCSMRAPFSTSKRRRVVNNQWRNAIQVMGGRLIKFSAQLTF